MTTAEPWITPLESALLGWAQEGKWEVGEQEWKDQLVDEYHLERELGDPMVVRSAGKEFDHITSGQTFQLGLIPSLQRRAITPTGIIIYESFMDGAEPPNTAKKYDAQLRQGVFPA